MEFRYLGRSGFKVSELCLGAMTFGRETSEADSARMMDIFGEAGGNFIDTADVYNNGLSEEIIGRWLTHQVRERWVIATKVRFTMGALPNQQGLSRTHILRSIDDSLRRLQTDYIDLYQVHCWDNGTPIEETLYTLERLVQAGKVRYVGVSNYKPHQLQKALDLQHQRGYAQYVSLQPLYNLLDRSVEWELAEVCKNEGLGILPWSPLRGGWLTGKVRRGMDGAPEGTRIHDAEKDGWSERWTAYNTERTWQVVDMLLAVAAEVGKTPAQVALNWLKDRPAVTAPILGARTLAQLEDNLGAVGWALSAEQRQRLTDVSRMEGPYPYGEYDSWAERE
ncbi:MAG: aldo/keto reductase [Anaerolineae bacterium]|nr:aldo/keto reductase [Anaerolineae bacterium]